jgi:hypothetical protein
MCRNEVRRWMEGEGVFDLSWLLAFGFGGILGFGGQARQLQIHSPPPPPSTWIPAQRRVCVLDSSKGGKTLGGPRPEEQEDVIQAC